MEANIRSMLSPRCSILRNLGNLKQILRFERIVSPPRLGRTRRQVCNETISGQSFTSLVSIVETRQQLALRENQTACALIRRVPRSGRVSNSMSGFVRVWCDSIRTWKIRKTRMMDYLSSGGSVERARENA
jgi:hypothetical protein